MAITLAVTYRVDDPLQYRQEELLVCCWDWFWFVFCSSVIEFALTCCPSCSCWLAALDQNKYFSFGKPMFWAFLLPVGLILIYNIVLLTLTSLTTCRVDPKLTR